MKEVIISFIIYVIYDAYMRKRDEDIFLTKEEFIKLSAQSKAVSESQDLSEVNRRLKALEDSPYA